jgi:hypothetical protein
MYLLAIAGAAAVFLLGTAAAETQDTLSTIELSLNGCLSSKDATIVLPSTNPESLKAGLASVGRQFPVTIFATEAHFNNPQTLNMLQGVSGQRLHTIAYQFSPELSWNADKATGAQVEAALTKAKQTFKTFLNQSLMYALVPSVASRGFVEAILKSGVYPVVPNSDSDTLPKAGIQSLGKNGKGVVLSINPSVIDSTPDFANELFSAGYTITPLTHCLPVVYSTTGKDLQAQKGHAKEADPDTATDGEGKKEEETVASGTTGGIPWGMIAIAALVVAGGVLAVYFYKTQV